MTIDRESFTRDLALKFLSKAQHVNETHQEGLSVEEMTAPGVDPPGVAHLLGQLAIDTDTPLDIVIQEFAGFLTEHTMGIVQQGGPRGSIGAVNVKLQDSKGALVERNGSDPS